MAVLGELIIRIVGDNKDFDKSVESSEQKLNGLEKQSSQTAGIINQVLVGALIAGAAASIKLASDAEESGSKFNAVFKEQSDEVRSWAETYSESVNRSSLQTIQFLSTIQDTLVPLGFAREAAAEMSKSVVTLSNDLASFNNLPTEQVVRDIQSALVGNTETLRKYGVVASQDAIIQEALNSGLIENKNQLDANTKAQAIYNLVVQGTADAQGDALRTSGSFANQMRGLEAAFVDLGVEVGETLLPALSDMVGLITDIIKGITGIVAAIRELNQSNLDVTEKILAQALGSTKDIFGNWVSIDERLERAASITNRTKNELIEIIKGNEELLSLLSDTDKTQLGILEKNILMANEVIKIRDRTGSLQEAVLKIAQFYGVSEESIKEQLRANEDLLVSLTDQEKIYLGINEIISESKETTEELTELQIKINELSEKWLEIIKPEEDPYKLYKQDLSIILEKTQEVTEANEDLEESLEKTKQRYIEVAEAVGNIAAPIFESFGEAIVDQGNAWQILKEAAKEAIVGILKALGREALVRAAIAFATLRIGRGIALTTASALAFTTAGIVAALQEGGLVMPRAGGVPVIMAEGGVPEYAVPERSDVMTRLADRISENMRRPVNNIFRAENNVSFPERIYLDTGGGSGFWATLTKASKNGKFLIDQRRGLAER